MRLPTRDDLLTFSRAEWRHLTTFQASDRMWRMPLAAALASGLPLLVGAWFGHPEYGLISSLGGMVFLYLPETSLSHRMITIMSCAFGMIACYALGVISHFFPLLLTPALAFAAILVTLVCRFYSVAPPGNVFFIMAVSIGMFTPGEVIEIPLKVGLLTMGCLLACLIAFFYSLHVLRLQAPKPLQPAPPPTFDFVVFDSVVIGLSIGASLALAQALQMERAYWAPVSCAAVIQGASLRAVWTKQLHRVVGTSIGLLLTWALLLLPFDRWTTPLIMTALAFIIETLVVRHYGLAAIFITPMAIFLAEAATLGHASPAALITARFFDTLLGCAVGLIGGACLHNQRFREVAGAPLRRFSRARLLR
jgi:uncharacterized membrane protein YccC